MNKLEEWFVVYDDPMKPIGVYHSSVKKERDGVLAHMRVSPAWNWECREEKIERLKSWMNSQRVRKNGLVKEIKRLNKLNRDLEIKINEVKAYSEPHTSFMWGAKIMGILMGIDFRDVPILPMQQKESK